MTQVEAQEAIRNRRKSNGLCQRCGKTSMIGKTICQSCSAQLSANRKSLQNTRLTLGLCIKCGKIPHRPDAQRCKSCTSNEKQKAHEIYELREKAGTCRYCDSPRVGESTLCRKHYFEQGGKRYFNRTSLAAQLEQKLIQQGYRCYLSGCDLILGTNTCIEHKNPINRFPELKGDLNNIAWSCWPCNKMKNNKTVSEFIEYCKKVTQYNKVTLA